MRLSPHPLTLRQLQYIVAVADQRSFRKAAEACHVSQPSLSAQIAQVEDALGVQLFERDRRGVALTAAGALLVERARHLLVLADDLVDAAQGLAEPFTGTLRLGVIPTVGPYLLPTLAPFLRERYPRLTVLWVEEKTPEVVRRLEGAELDGAIVALEAELGDVEHVVLGKDTFVLAAPEGHPLVRGKGPLDPEALDHERVLLLDEGHCLREQALEVCARWGAEEPGFRATSLPTLSQMVASGLGVTLLPELAAPVEAQRASLGLRRFRAKDAPARTLALIWRKRSAQGPTLRALGAALHEAWPNLVRSP